MTTSKTTPAIVALALLATACGPAPVDNTAPNGNEVPESTTEAMQPATDADLREQARVRGEECVENIFGGAVNVLVSMNGLIVLPNATENFSNMPVYYTQPVAVRMPGGDVFYNYDQMDPATQQRALEIRACVTEHIWVPIETLRERAAEEAAALAARAAQQSAPGGTTAAPTP